MKKMVAAMMACFAFAGVLSAFGADGAPDVQQTEQTTPAEVERDETKPLTEEELSARKKSIPKKMLSARSKMESLPNDIDVYECKLLKILFISTDDAERIGFIRTYKTYSRKDEGGVCVIYGAIDCDEYRNTYAQSGEYGTYTKGTNNSDNNNEHNSPFTIKKVGKKIIKTPADLISAALEIKPANKTKIILRGRKKFVPKDPNQPRQDFTITFTSQ